jgi:hypothetical protein
MLLRTGVTRFSRAGETESQQEEGECLEEDVGVVVVGGAHQEVDRHQDFGDVNSAFTAPLAYIYATDDVYGLCYVLVLYLSTHSVGFTGSSRGASSLSST